MPTERFRVPAINSLMPSTDARNSDQAFVLSGRNFTWDSKGPKSGFTSRILTPFPFGLPNDIQGKRVEGRTFVFTQDAILNWRSTTPITWDILYAFSTRIPDSMRFPWSVIYMDGTFYMAQRYRGFFSADALSNTERLWIHRKTDLDIPGLIPDIQAMDVVRGRAILVNDTMIQWSDLLSLDDLTPALGGPGFQLINQFVKGKFRTLTSFQDGFVVWTTEGAVLAEWIGGDEVWRFSAYESQERPFGPWSTATLINGGSVSLTRRGIKVTNATQAPQDWTPDFNEFLREYLDDRVEFSTKWRLEYDQSTETIYVSESSNLDKYWRTFVLKPTLNKWGIFSDRVYGFLPLTEELFGYVDERGVPNYFDPKTFNRETEPDNALGLSLIYPRFEKQHNVLSSSAVSRAIIYDVTVPYSSVSVAQAGWYPPHAPDALQANGLMGMDSDIEVGYLRPSSLGESADGLIEIQQMVIGSVNSAAPAVMDFTTEWNQEYFYAETEDLNSEVTLTPGDALEDWLIEPDELLDLLTAPNYDALDYMHLDFPTASWDEESTWDLMSEDGIDDMHGITLGLPEITYQISLESSQDGITVASVTPELARFDTGMRTWATLSSGNLHRLRLRAEAVNEFYHLQYLELTTTYAGRVG